MATKSDRNLPYNFALNLPILETHLPERRKCNSVIVGSDRRLNTLAEFNSQDTRNEAVKFDQDKLDWSLLPFEALEGTVKVLQFGATKYARSNWKVGGGFKYTRTIGACLRHLFAYLRGEDLDPESGLSHIDHAMCNLIFLAYFIRNKAVYNKDDRETNV